jgi:hypothetical protein
MELHLAEINVARALTPLDAPEMADFVALIPGVNELADRSPGFVWRLQTEYGDATGIRAFDDAAMLVNMSVWRDLEALRAFTYASDHLVPFRARRRWFAPPTAPHMALWWIPAGTIPTLQEGKDRLDAVVANGPTPIAFTFKHAFAPDGTPLDPEARRLEPPLPPL